MDALARHFGYSRSRFSRLFHDHLGCSMIEYLSVLRCREAAQLLLESDMTMLDIAMKVGFECLRTFYRAFKACYGVTPSQYVRIQTEGHAHKAPSSDSVSMVQASPLSTPELFPEDEERT